MNTGNLISNIAVFALPMLFAITVHEAAHGYVARHFGDNTAWKMGRITLNPMSHIDPMGTIVMPLLLYFSTGGAFMFGYAKPVPVRFGNLRNPKRDMVWVALAGPASNLIMALLWGVAFILLRSVDVSEDFFLGMCKAGVGVNVGLFALNLFPLPPLDGGRILVGLLPYPQAVMVSRVEPFGFFIVMGLIVTHVLDYVWITPVMHLTLGLLNLVFEPLRALLL